MGLLSTNLSSGEVRALAAFITAVLCYLAYWVTSRSLATLARRGHVHPQIEARVRGGLRVFAFVTAVLLTVQQAGAFQHAWAIVSALVTTVAIGFFAIWSVLSNVICAFLIMLFRPFRVGDWVEVIEGPPPFPGGKLVDMNLLFVSLEQVSAPVQGGEASPAPPEPASYVRVPNTLFFQKIVRCRPGTERREDSGFFQ